MRAVPPALLLLLLLLPLGACAPQEPETFAAAAITDGPARAGAVNIIAGAADAFAHPDALAGHPAEAAVAVARLEWLAAEVPRALMFRNFSSITAPALQAGRTEARRALGIRAGAPTQAVVDGLVNAAGALRAGNPAGARAALSPPDFAPDTLDRLAALPRLPQASAALQRARRDLEFGRDDDIPFAFLSPTSAAPAPHSPAPHSLVLGRL